MLMGAAHNALWAFNARVSLTLPVCHRPQAATLALRSGAVRSSRSSRWYPSCGLATRGHGAPAVWLGTNRNVSVCLILRRWPPNGLSLSRSYNGTPRGKGNTQRPVLDQLRSKSRMEIISFASSRPRRSSSTWGRG